MRKVYGGKMHLTLFYYQHDFNCILVSDIAKDEKEKQKTSNATHEKVE